MKIPGDLVLPKQKTDDSDISDDENDISDDENDITDDTGNREVLDEENGKEDDNSGRYLPVIMTQDSLTDSKTLRSDSDITDEYDHEQKNCQEISDSNSFAFDDVNSDDHGDNQDISVTSLNSTVGDKLELLELSRPGGSRLTRSSRSSLSSPCSSRPLHRKTLTRNLSKSDISEHSASSRVKEDVKELKSKETEDSNSSEKDLTTKVSATVQRSPKNLKQNSPTKTADLYCG